VTYRIGVLELVCPRCRSDLVERARDAELACAACAASYPVIGGIPDLRVAPDPYISLRGDRAKAEMLARHIDQLDLAGIVALYFDVTPEVPEKDVRLNTSRVLGGMTRAGVALDALQATTHLADDDLFHGRRWLDVGCGSAPLVAALASRGVPVVGVDIALRWLMIGRRQLLDLGLDAPLIAACAEALPFRDCAFDVVAFQSSLEVVQDQQRSVAEAFRVTSEGGRLVVSTPNRTSLGPDPHIGVYGGGFLPRRLVNVFARLQLVRPPHRNLLTRRSLSRLLRDGGWEQVEITLPGVSRSQREQFRGLSRRLADAYETGRTTPGLRELLQVVGPLLQASAVRGGSRQRGAGDPAPERRPRVAPGAP
jgi:SAM-dependent methyltransferase